LYYQNSTFSASGGRPPDQGLSPDQGLCPWTPVPHHSEEIDFIAKDQWPPNSPDLNALKAFHKLYPKPKTTPELKSIGYCNRSGMTCHRQRSTKLSMTFANI